ncbi:hypothetical protein K492DRAFT_190282 [Lichtheimia hyalospora FSU 10163]|nr:hypothetical protein K492DRAFT_190282 [Lichtheimia hyalospora FSU 10163]
MAFTREEFQQAIQGYRNAYAADTIFADHLNDKIIQHPNQLLFFIRYVGATGNDTPFGRLQNDLDQAHLGGRRFYNFVNTVRQLFPQKTFQVYDIPLLATAGVFGQPGPQSAELDVIERILIHLLDRQCLINSQPGGFYISYTSNENDLNLLTQINAPNAIAYLVSPDNVEGVRHVNQELLALFQEYRAELTGVDQVMAGRITDEHLELFAHQALPHANRFHQVNEQTAMVPSMMVGKDNTVQDFSLQHGFFEGSRSGTITGDLMRMALNGMQNQPLANHLDLQLQVPCFGDLWPIPKHDYFWELHTQSLSRMLAHVNPAVMVTCGFDVARVAMSNFHDRYALSSPRYRDIVGVPMIINHDATFSYEDEPEGAEPQQGWCVVIPHMHPGTANYGNVDPRIIRMMFLCWIRTLLLVDAAINIAAESPHPTGSQAFAQQLLAEWQNREPVALSDAINEARIAVNELRSNGQAGIALLQRNEGLPVGLGARNIGETSRRTLLEKWQRYGWAEGAIGSAERVQHYVRLSRYQWPELLSCPSYNNDREAFRNWFINQLAQGTNVMQAILRRAQEENIQPMGDLTPMQVHYLTTRCQPPPDWPQDDNTWILIDDLREAAMEAARIRFREKWGGPTLGNPELNRQRRNEYLTRQGNIAYETFNMCRVKVSSMKARLRVIINDQQLYIPDGIAIQSNVTNGIRFIDYDPNVEQHGLVIRDEFGNILPSAQQPAIIWDHWLLRKAPNVYFITFQRTVNEHGLQLRQGILDQLALNQEFTYERILDLYWHELCQGRARVVYTKRGRVPQDAEEDSYMADAIRAVLATNAIGMENLVWEHLLSNEDRYFLTVRPLLQGMMQARDPTLVITRVPRRYAHMSPHGAYNLPAYVPPQ